MQNYVIEFKDWDSYNAESKEDAIKQFKDEHGDDTEILSVSD